MSRYWLNPASVLIWAIRLSTVHRCTVRTHRRPEPEQRELFA